MSIKRIYTDVPAGEDEQFLLAMIKADKGVVEHRTKIGGRVTISVNFPDRTAAVELPPAGASTAAWMAVAQKELNDQVVEFSGAGSNPRVEAYAASTKGGAVSDDVPWCSSFVNFCMTQAGLKGTDSKRARSWEAWGVSSPTLVPGCIVVLERGKPKHGHVGFFVGMDGDRIQLLGGNQGNAVSIASFDAGRVVARRLPT